MTARKLPEAPRPPIDGATLTRIGDMGLVVVSWRKVIANGYYLPEDMIGRDGKTMIIWRAARDHNATYAFDGWHPWHDGMFGGCRATLASALAWVQCARDVRAGIVADFRGV